MPRNASARDLYFMRLALEEARKGVFRGEVPVGAVVTRNDALVASARNRREELKDPTAHAEILVLREASYELGDWRLEGCVLYVTLEPCLMCAGAILQTRIKRVLYGAQDPKGGACGSIYDLLNDGRVSPRREVVGGVLEEESSELLRSFFYSRRKA
ncbi:tRNA adenosine(34) deaminase TadA [Acetomicrobium sp. S15 = DSM 107314]|uniref:tRNA adenosine(34) deaminase TadA n=1 Tax=Acetomicrobium sp. S15 = DSM 107314 TaxID=2529858 RepID=UPI003158B072